jgi:hypothetical protein
MLWLVVSNIFSAILKLIQIGRLSEKDKDLELMILYCRMGTLDNS